jgi:hypothetical protein
MDRPGFGLEASARLQCPRPVVSKTTSARPKESAQTPARSRFVSSAPAPHSRADCADMATKDQLLYEIRRTCLSGCPRLLKGQA